MSAHSPQLSHPEYRPDIDGLRAIAVLTVVGFHAFPGWVKGGFIGVDIFFVISGFLISLIIFSNLERDSFSLAEFYRRRIKRVFPALLLVMVTCYVFGWFVLFADEYMQLGKHIAAGAGFVSNFALWNESGYFDSAAETKPLLHLWSLAIEEQFYIFWPLLLAFMWKRKLSFVTVTATVATISFAVNIYAINHDPTAAFFLPVPRFWELMIGGLLAYVALHKPQLNHQHQNIQSVMGVTLLAMALLFLNKASAFPGWWALLPTLGTFFIISAGPNAWINKRVLSNKVLVWVGLISYPLYLWHWPLLSFAHILVTHPSRELRIAVVLLAFLLAWLTYSQLERRIRWSRHNKTVLGLAITLLAVLLMGYITFAKYGFMKRETNKPFANTDQSLYLTSRHSDDSCKTKLGLDLLAEEVCLTSSEAPQFLFTGDSHAMALYSAINSKKYSAPATIISGHACALYPELEYTPTHEHSWGNNCTSIANEVIRFAQASSTVKTVIITNYYPQTSPEKPSVFRFNGHTLSEQDAFTIGTGHLIDQLVQLGKEVIYVVDVPHLKFDPKQCEARGIFPSLNQCTFNRNELDQSRSSYIQALKKLSQQHPKLKVFDTTELFCNAQTCYAANADGALLYADFNHLSINGSARVLKALLGR